MDTLAKAELRSQLSCFMRHCETEAGRRFARQCVDPVGHAGEDFHVFSVREFRTFWRLFLLWSHFIHEGAVEPVCEGDLSEVAQFFPQLRVNYAENLLSGPPDVPALIARHGDGRREQLSLGELRGRALRLAHALDRLGVGSGDRVVCIARNNPEAIIAALAAASLGAVFSSCGPDMGAFAALARFAPLAPVALLANTRAERWDVGAPLTERVAETVAGLPSLHAVVGLDDGPLPDGCASYRLDRLIGSESESAWQRRPFNHPLFAMFSSGTTGAPKCILHGAGGTLLEHVKEHRLHCDLRPGEQLFFQTSCGWMMWNWQLSALASQVTLVLYDGPLLAPETLWRIVAEERVSVFGTSPAYLRFCQDAQYSPRQHFDFRALRSILSTGSILYPGQYDWAADHVGAVPLQSISGGTDIIGCFVLGHPDLPVHRGEAQCRSLGLDVRSLPPPDEPDSKVGELVCANPFPSRPIGLWDDPCGKRFHEAYFAQNPGMWTHGDLIEFTATGGARLHGRSDGVLNIRGVRIGPAEIYAALQEISEIAEAMAVEQQVENAPGGSRLILLVALRTGARLDTKLAERLRAALLTRGSAEMVPARIADVSALPETHNGKRSEAAARAAVNGQPVRNRSALRNPECLNEIAAHPALSTSAAAESDDPLPLDERLEEELQALCERVLEVAPIGRNDNLFAVRGDSLATLTLFMEAERRSSRHLSFEALFGAPSIEGLAKLLRDQRSGRPGEVIVRPAGDHDTEAIATLLSGVSEAGQFEHLERDVWRELFRYRWHDAKPDLGFVLVHHDEIVGFLGAVYAQRSVNGKEGMVCNLSSWYVRRQYRGWGPALVSGALRDGVTYTTFTPNRVSQQVFRLLGFSVLNETLLLMPPLLHADTFKHRAPVIISDPDSVRRLLTGEEQRAFDDHAPYCLQLAVREGEELAYIVARRRMMLLPKVGKRLPTSIRMPCSDILYCSNPPLLARHLERVKLAILRRQKTVLLTAYARLFPQRPRGPTRMDVSLYRSPLFGADEIDRLYSEFVLLPI